MRKLTTSMVIVLAVCSFIAYAQDQDIDSNVFNYPNDGVPFSCLGPINVPMSGMDNQWDLLFNSGITALIGDTQVLGSEFAGDHFYVTGGNSSTQPNQVYVIDRDGTTYTQFDQWNSGGWGWKDLVYDGTYLYGSSNYTINCFDLDGNSVPDMDITSPISPHYALAYDPVTDHFWIGNDSPLYEIDRDGNVIWEGPTGLTSIWGAAWDDADPNGPWLWLFTQNGWPCTTLMQFDPVNHVMTGTTYAIPYLPGQTQQFAGSLFFTDEWDPNVSVIGGLIQGDPEDQLFILEMYGGESPNVTIDVTYVSGSPVPAGGGHLELDLYLENLEMSAVNFDLWIAMQYEGGPPSTLAQRNLTFPAGHSIYRQSMMWPIPRNYAAGEYVFWGRVGDEPDQIWNESGFLFIKEGTDHVAGFTPYPVDRAPNPLDQIITGGGEEYVLPDEFALHSAYPNPFNPTTTISYQITANSHVILTVYDVSGKQVAELVDGWRQAGRHELEFDATNLTSGVYIIRMQAGEFNATGKMILMK